MLLGHDNAAEAIWCISRTSQGLGREFLPEFVLK
jgi:hypothetical protein